MGIGRMGANGSTPKLRARRIAIAVAATAAFASAAPAAGALETATHATGEVQRWASNKSFDAPYAFVEVTHDGHALDRVAINRCKGTYMDKAITVQIGTCGPRWHVRAAYVSMNGRNEHFRIVYAPRLSP